MEHGCNDGDGRQTYFDEKLSRCHFVHQKSYMDLPGIFFVLSFLSFCPFRPLFTLTSSVLLLLIPLEHKHLCPRRDFFVFSCTLYFIPTCFLVLIILHFSVLSLVTTHNTNIHVLAVFEPEIPAKREPANPRLKMIGQ